LGMETEIAFKKEMAAGSVAKQKKTFGYGDRDRIQEGDGRRVGGKAEEDVWVWRRDEIDPDWHQPPPAPIVLTRGKAKEDEARRDMEDAERFDPIKGLSPRVLARLDDAPELDLNEEELPAPGETVQVWYPPVDYAQFAARKFVVETELLEVVQWYRPCEDEGIVALIGRDARPPHTVQVLYGTDWTPDETVALKAAQGLVRFKYREHLERIDALDAQYKVFTERLEKVELDRKLKKAERERALKEGLAIDVLVVERSSPTIDEQRASYQARTRALDLMADKDVHVAVASDKKATELSLHRPFGALVLIELVFEEVEELEDPYPILSPEQAQLADGFLAADKPVWVWRDSQGVKITGHADGKHDRGDGERVTVAVLKKDGAEKRE